MRKDRMIPHPLDMVRVLEYTCGLVILGTVLYGKESSALATMLFRGSAQAQHAPERNMAVSSVLLCNHVLALRHSHMSSKRSKVKKAGSFSL